MELQLRRMQRARQTRPPLGPQGLPLSTAMPPAAPVESPGFKEAPKGLRKLKRMDTSDSLTEMNCRDSFTAPATPHPGSSNTRSKGRKAVTAVTPPPPPQKQVDANAVKSLLDDLATTLRSVADGRTACFGIEEFTPPRRHEVDDDFDAQMRDLSVQPSKEEVGSWETQFRLWRGPVFKDSSSTTLDLGRSTNVEVQREVFLSAVHAMKKQLKKVLQSEQQHVIEKAGYWIATFKKVAAKPKGKHQSEIYFVLDNPAKPTTLESSTMTRVDREAVRVLQALVHQCGGKVKHPPASKRRRRPRRRPKKDNSLKRALAKGRAADALAGGL